MSATFSLSHEENILACLMENPGTFDGVAAIVNDQDFYLPEHAALFKTISWLAQRNQLFDAISVTHVLEKHGRLEAMGGPLFIARINSNGSNSPANVERYASEVRSMSVARKLLAACERIAEMIEQPTLGDTVETILDRAESAILSIKDLQAKSSEMGPRAIRDVMRDCLSVLDRRVVGGQTMGLDTGFAELNEVLLGLHPKTLNIIAAVPGMGKTTFAMNLLENAIKAKSVQGAVVVFSMEMGDTDIAERMISSVGGVHQHKMRSNDMDDMDWGRVGRSVGEISEWPVYIDETPGMNIMEMRSRLRRIARKHDGKIGAVMVDYLQLMRAVERQPDRQREVAEIAVGLKSLSKEFDCPVLALSQLSREIAKRVNKRPLMTDLRESGYIEQAADVILFIYRDEKYNENTKDKGLAEIIVAKQRKGEADRKIMLRFDGSRSRFLDCLPGGYAHV